MTIRAVVFDVGGVLERVDTMQWLEVWPERLGLTAQEFHACLERVDPTGRVVTGELSEAQYRQRYQSMLGLNDEQTSEFLDQMWDWYCGELDQQLCDYVATLRPTYKTAILSNSADGARREEQVRYGFEELLDTIIYSHEVGLAKPDPRIYALTCERLGVAPGETVLLDDVPENVDAALACGWHAVLHHTTPESISEINRLLATGSGAQHSSA